MQSLKIAKVVARRFGTVGRFPKGIVQFHQRIEDVFEVGRTGGSRRDAADQREALSGQLNFLVHNLVLS
jgi:hypothetical protein